MERVPDNFEMLLGVIFNQATFITVYRLFA